MIRHRPPGSARLMTRASRVVIGALLLVVFGYQVASVSALPCPDDLASRTADGAMTPGGGQMPGMDMPVDAAAPATASHAAHAPTQCTHCGTLAMVGGCGACSLPSLTTTTLVAPGDVPAVPIALRLHLRPRSIDVRPDVPPPRT